MGFDTNRIFTSGCSMGSAFSEYIASCIKEDQPNVISAFATHSTGLKVKGDGNKFPAATLDRNYTWGECPKCQYFPFKPKAFNDPLGLKACIFDNTGDKSIQDPQFYRSSEALAKEWQALGMKAETHFADGGHCQIHSYEDIVTCLMSVGESGAGTAESKSDVNLGAMTEDEQIEYAMRMSMAQEAAEASAAEGAEKMDVDEQKGDEDYSEAMNDPAFLQSVLESLPGVDPQSDAVRQAVGAMSRSGT